FQPIEWPQFLRLFDPIKHLLHPEFCLLAERDNQAEGFVVAVPDPLKYLSDYQKKSARWPILDFLWKGMTLLRLKRNRERLLVLYIGRKSGSKTPWLTFAMGQAITQEAVRRGYHSADICFLGEKSPAYVGLPSKHSTIATYALFEKQI